MLSRQMLSQLAQWPPSYGNVRPGFRLALGLDLDISEDLPGLATAYRSFTNFPGEGRRSGSKAFVVNQSAYTVLVNALERATSE